VITLRNIVTAPLHRFVDALLTRRVDAWVAQRHGVRLIQVGASYGVMADPVHAIGWRPTTTSILTYQ
jgi:hypothetical protein